MTDLTGMTREQLLTELHSAVEELVTFVEALAKPGDN